ncbi:PAS domain S-box protein [Halomicroarcula sp. S1AR25-4]|uniref:PAS domain S-box protein n=1 Tax=Haloarcula sp. S1AR25-4 TaxID=2950538 RepID=UPI0028756C33|nr:PAS domain S-box protein [Halomicroarcula sp. S1AR25-4]MDS0276662.1 PAS domain S-box protein [Halomicroarcula sp. S1AR25-4]
MADGVPVLYVNDDAQLAESTAERLERTDERLSVRTATTVSGGMAVLDAATIDCVVSAFEMANRDGLEFLDAVRTTYPDLPFVLFAADGSEAVASEAMTMGATAYLRNQGGSERYEVLSDRIRTAVEKHRAARRAAEQERVSRVMRGINRALVRTDSREAIERRVCELLSDAEPYRFAWVGRHDPETETIEPTNWAGVDASYLDGVTITVDETPTGQGPAGRAFRTGQIAVSQDIRSDPAFEPWREDALTYGFRAVAAIPLSYEGTCYGLLAVYADRPSAFDDSERTLLSELGDDIAHAIQAQQTRTELERTTTRLESLFDNSPDMIAVHDAEGTIVDANPTLCEELGYTKSELVRMSVWDIDVNVEVDEANRIWERLDDGDRFELETKFRRRDGTTFPAEVHIRRAQVGGEVQFVVNSRDISDHKARQQQLEARSTALASTTDGMAILDANDEYVFVNQAHAEVYGYDDPAAFLGESWRMCYSETEIERLGREVLPEFRESGEWLGEATGVRADGETFPQEVSLTRLDDGGLVCVVRDVTERKEQVEKLELIQRRTRALMATQTAERSAQVAVQTAREVIGAEITGYHALSEDGQRLTLVTDADCVRGGIDEAPEYERDSDDPVASVVWEVFEGSDPLYVEDTDDDDRLAGNTPAGSGIIYPVTDYGVFIVSAARTDAFSETDRAILDILVSTLTVALQRVERESLLRERESELTRQNKRLEEFASVVSHDLRNPLSVLEGSLELAEATGDTEHFERGKRALARMDQLIEELLSMARSGQSIDETEPVDVDRLVTACWQNVATGAATLHADATGRIYASESRFKQLLENLFGNSVEHGSTGSQTASDDSVERGRSAVEDADTVGESVTVRVGPLDDGTGFYVEDDGPGISPDERQRVFESGYSNSPDGTGFGLAIVDRIADAHGWDVTLSESAEGGARFEIAGVERVE